MIDIIIISIVLIASIANMIADIFLVSGKNHRIKKQSRIDIIKNTPDKHLFLSVFIGSVSISLWLTVLYYLAKLEYTIGSITMLIFTMYIAFVMLYHSMCSFAFYVVKYDESKYDQAKKLLVFFMIITSILSLSYTLLMIYLWRIEVIEMNIYQLLTLPFFSMIIIQFGLGKLFNKIPHFSSIAGTLGMLVALLSTISIFI